MSINSINFINNKNYKILSQNSIKANNGVENSIACTSLKKNNISFGAISDALKAKNALNISTLEQTRSNFKRFFDNFITSNDGYVDNLISNINLDKYSKTGIPLKYPRVKMVEDLIKAMTSMSFAQKQKALSYFGLTFEEDINGIPKNLQNSDIPKEYREMQKILAKFCLQNETISNNPTENAIFNSIVKEFPEFNMIVGKTQHGAHNSTLDIHTLKVLQKAIQNPRYKKLDENSKKVLKLAIIIHDFGKKGYVVTTGHENTSAIIAGDLFMKYPIDNEIRQRVLNLVQNHHWFSKYNQNQISAKQVVDLFKNNSAQLAIAKIFAKADFESINPDYHLTHMSSRQLTQSEFDYDFENKTSCIQTTIDRVLDKIKMSNRVLAGIEYPNLSMNRILNQTQKNIYESSYQAFSQSKNNRITYKSLDRRFLTPDNMLHATNSAYLESIFENGFLSREFTNITTAKADGVAVDTLTPLCCDVWDVNNTYKIQDYFNPKSSHWLENRGEKEFMPSQTNKTGVCNVIISFNKKALDKRILNNSFLVAKQDSALYENGCMSGHNYKTHRAVPIGIPANAIDRLILDTSNMNNPSAQIQKIKNLIAKKGLDIELYDLYGTKL